MTNGIAKLGCTALAKWHVLGVTSKASQVNRAATESVCESLVYYHSHVTGHGRTLAVFLR